MTAEEAERPSIVVRDKRRIDVDARGVGSGSAAKSAGPDPKSTAKAKATEKTEDKAMNDATNEPTEGEPEVVEMTISPPDDTPAETSTAAETSAETSTAAEAEAAASEEEEGNAGAPVYAELESLRKELDELTRHLQRVTAEYANYRKRVDRDRAQAGEAATGIVLAALLPVLDDLDRARRHGDLVGPFGSVADQLTAALGKFGLAGFGEPGDPFDPTIHEAVSHKSSPDVTETTCVEIMRRGYMLGDRLLRPALVGVADPE